MLASRCENTLKTAHGRLAVAAIVVALAAYDVPARVAGILLDATIGNVHGLVYESRLAARVGQWREHMALRRLPVALEQRVQFRIIGNEAFSHTMAAVGWHSQICAPAADRPHSRNSALKFQPLSRQELQIDMIRDCKPLQPHTIRCRGRNPHPGRSCRVPTMHLVCQIASPRRSNASHGGQLYRKVSPSARSSRTRGCFFLPGAKVSRSTAHKSAESSSQMKYVSKYPPAAGASSLYQ